MTADRPHDGAELLEHGAQPPRWQRQWTALPPRRRRLAAAVGVLVLVGSLAVAVVGQLRNWASERELQQQVLIATSLGVWTSSTSPPGGRVSYFVSIRNGGSRPLSVTSVAASTDRLGLHMRDADDRPVAAGREVQIPLSVALTCLAGEPSGGTALPAEVRVRRADGGSTAVPVDLQPSALLLDVAATLCSVRPGLRDYELSGPVLRTGPDDRLGG